MDMELVITKEAAKTLLRMQPKIREAMARRLRAIADDPYGAHANVKAMAGTKNEFRLRQGDWRAVYFIHKEADQMHVTKIGQGGQVYK